MIQSYRPHDLHAAGTSTPLTLAAQGFFWVGAERVDLPSGPALKGQTYVEYWIPQNLTHPLPIVMIHGGGGQGTDMLGTADGRDGWAKWFVRAGYAVYVIDRPGHGRAPYYPDLLGEMKPAGGATFLEEMFCKPEEHPERYPQAHLHDKWPGSGKTGDPCFDSFLAGTGPSPIDLGQSHIDAQRGGVALLDVIGPAILLTHSAGGPSGWLIADARPDLVKGLIAVEPLGPPVEAIAGGLTWGITAAPLAYDPPLADPSALRFEKRPAPHPDLVACFVQAEPARQLPNLAKMPIVVVTAEASWMAADNHGMVDYLVQAGASAEHLRLEHHGVHGNGHAMMLETNSDDVAAVIEGWVQRKGLA
jgi:pimeloyl-ACP methyl ester carboxylesterase